MPQRLPRKIKSAAKSGAVPRRGSLLLNVLIATSLFVVIGTLALQFVMTQNSASKARVERDRSFEIAEAGIDYYRWHLAHVPGDFQDGTGAPGPYVHQYRDTSGNAMGTYSLDITPPVSGSTVVTIKSTGVLTGKPLTARTIVAKEGIPSFTKWAVVANADMRFGVGTEVFGPIHSNGGIRFDGLAHNIVTSYRYRYADPDHGGSQELAVHTHVAPIDPIPPATPPATIPNRPDVFQAGRQVQADYVDFVNITANLSDLKTKSIASGIHLLPSSGQGYHLTLRSDGKVDMRIVNTVLRCQYRSGGQWNDYGYCSNNFNNTCTQNSNCGTGGTCLQSSHSVGSRAADQSSFTYDGASSLGVTLPANGIIFVEDDVWIDGAVNNARVTVVAAKEPLASGQANIYINNNLTYTPTGDTSGNDAIGLIAQQNILIGYFSQNTIRVDAALIAQNGRVGRPNYSPTGSSYRLYPTDSTLPNGGGGENSCDDFRPRSTITSFGAIATNQRYGFAWTGSSFCSNTQSSGFCNRNLIFDTNLAYAPPPDFPTTGQYETISWEEQ